MELKQENISIRTMESDLEALKQSGGEVTQDFSSGEIKTSSYPGSEKQIFPLAQKSLKSEMETAREGSSWIKLAGIIFLVVLAIVACGFLGYFVISHWIFPKQMPAV